MTLSWFHPETHLLIILADSNPNYVRDFLPLYDNIQQVHCKQLGIRFIVILLLLTPPFAICKMDARISTLDLIFMFSWIHNVCSRIEEVYDTNLFYAHNTCWQSYVFRWRNCVSFNGFLKLKLLFHLPKMNHCTGYYFWETLTTISCKNDIWNR